jgi:hypothetical protein
MLLRPDGDGAVIAVGQAAHAWLAGQLARAWGNADFPAPSPREEVCLGAEQHDVGMALWDLQPEVDPATGLPVPFFRMDRPTHLRLWAGAPEHLLSQSRYAALLISLHGTGLYERFPPRTGDEAVLRAVEAYLEGQRALQRRLAEEVGADEDELRRNQALLAAWDDLSLALCQAQLPRTVPDVPAAAGAVAMTASDAGDGGRVTIDPWPFSAADEVVVQAEGRRLTGRFADSTVLREALARAPHVALRIVLQPAS